MFLLFFYYFISILAGCIVVIFLLETIFLVSSKVPTISSNLKIIEIIGRHIKITSNTKICDLGSGIGTFLIAFSKRYGCIGEGIELSPLAWLASRMLGGLSLGVKVRFILGDLYKADLSKYDIIYCYLMPRLMRDLELVLKKLRGSNKIVISNGFRFPNLKPYKLVYSKSIRIYFYKL